MISKAHTKQIKSLHNKKFRDLEKLFLVEGKKVVKEILEKDPERVSELLATRTFIEENKGLYNNFSGKKFEVSEEELKQVSTLITPNMALAVCNYFDPIVPASKQNFDIYLDDIRDPGNFGTIIRAADWFGLKLVHCSVNSCDLYNPKVIQATMGAFMRVRVVYTDLHELSERGEFKKIYGAVMDGEDLYSKKLEKGLIVIGNEAAGISEENMRYISDKITIPSAGNNGSESLNAAMAAAIILSEFYRRS